MNKKILGFAIIVLLAFACKKEKTDQAAIDKAILLQYIADSSLTVDSSTSGLYYSIADTGTGLSPNSSSYVTVHYKGYFTNGTIFDQSSGTPIKGFLTSFIAGWQEGLPKIKKGGKIKLLIPSALAYGENGNSAIPGNTVLIFDVELLNVE
ncbi:MAG: FKBP-type peptidyl-prolyl cis-trans isomerase [Chitinophagales bacterium]|nr:FKBP-type peptidyl-prolyl cis-trans isomerase [Bacteroidota bacterium]